MPVGTVRGRFELDAPALQTLKDLEKQGIRTQAQMKALGEEMDRVGGQKDVAQIKEYDKAVTDMGADHSRIQTEMRKDWIETTRIIKREVGAQTRELDTLIVKLEEVNATHATPSVDVSGITAARAELAAFKRELSSVDRFRATPSVTARTATVGSSMGGGGGGPGPGMFGGGGGGTFRRSRGPLDFGMSGIRPRSALIGAGVAYAQPLLGGALSLGSSAGSAALGAGALGLTGYGAAAIGGGLTFATAKPMMTQLKAAQEAEKQYTQQVALHGATSKQAAAAQDKLNLALSQAPAHAAEFMRTLSDFKMAWATASRPAQNNLLGAASGFLGGVRPALPSFARSANVATTAVQNEATNFGAFLGGSTGRRAGRVGAGIFAENLPYVRRDLESIFTMWTNLMQASRPFFREANASVSQFLGHAARSSNDIGKLRGHIRTMVDDFKEWVRLAKALSRLIVDIAGVGRGSGTSLVKDMTSQLNTWDKWINRNPQKVHSFFRESVQNVKDLASALGRVTKALWDLLKNLGPTLDGLANLVGLAGGLGGGVLSSPTALLAGYAAFRGIKGGAGGGLRSLFGGGGAAAGAGGVSAVEAAALGGGAGLAGRRIFGPGFRSGAPISQLGRGRFLGSRIGARIANSGSALRVAGGAAGRAFLPFALFQAATSAAQSGLTPSQRGWAAVAGLDPTGLLPAPTPAGQRIDLGNKAAEDWAAKHPNATPRQIQAAQRSLITTPRGGWLGSGGYAGLTGPGGLRDAAQTDSGSDQVAKSRYAEYMALNKVLRESVRLRNQLKDSRDVQRAGHDITDLGKAFDTLNKHLGRKEAIKSWEKDFERMFSHLGTTGKRALARGGAQWVEQMRRNGQLTNKQAKEMDDGIAAHLQSIIGSFEKTGRRILVINGQIYDGTHKKWQEIQNAMGGAAEQALERVKDSFTKIQWYAVHTLESMGVGSAAAKRIVSMQDPQSSPSARRAGKFASANAGSPLSAGPYGQQRKVKERGGRLTAPGNTYDLSDRLHLGAGEMAAHGELVVNQHTENRINKLLAEKNTTLGREVAFEGRPHSKPGFARGGRRVPGAGGLSGALSGLGSVSGAASQAAVGQRGIGGAHPAVSAAVRLIMSANPGLSVTSTTGGGHVGGSFHYKGEAIDIAGAAGTMHQASEWIKRTGLYRQLAEGIHNPNLAVKYGQLFPGAGPFGSVWGNHRNHIHIAVLDSTNIGNVAAGAGGGGFGQITIPAPHSNLRGAPGAIADRAGSILARGMQDKVNRQLAKMGGGGGGFPGASGPWQSALQQIASAKGWNAADWMWIVQHESSGNPNNVNPSSGAFGLGQFLGSTKAAYAKFGATSRDPAQQINAMAHYIADRYGNPTAAKAFWQAHHWYELGGRRPGRDKQTFAGFMRHGGAFETMPGRAAHFVAGEGNIKEEVHVRPVRTPRIPALKGLAGSLTGGGVHFHLHGDVNASDPADVDKLVKKVGDEVGKKLMEHLGDDKATDLELIDG